MNERQTEIVLNALLEDDEWCDWIRGRAAFAAIDLEATSTEVVQAMGAAVADMLIEAMRGVAAPKFCHELMIDALNEGVDWQAVAKGVLTSVEEEVADE